ncbi:MFS transporter [Oceanirhabdus sp. W0125-5]|uniref:MFS transporter n=1 Tax=Oceanirhabdus sp. W0125-5 TaxID=2999116 RepID=UPI0022F2A8F5|nr:MFS transporter [Oceanirhabdus sp. W0125-5]WBW97164.1 MFS transporter [Oceanirhabdus sp. W0125-5]
MNESKRLTFNAWMFIIIYAVVGLLGGVCLDVLPTYLSISPETVNLAKSMSIFLGLGFLGGAALLLLIPKRGFKFVISLACIGSMIGLGAVKYVSSVPVLAVITGVMFVGVCLFDAILPSFLTCYTNEKNKNFIFSTAIWTNIAGMTIASFFGGTLITWQFGKILGIAYDKAKELTANTEAFTAIQNQAYLDAHTEVLFMFVAVAVIAFIPVLFIKQNPVDYKEVEKKEKKKFDWSIFANKYIVLFVLYTFLIRFGAGLITPHFSVFLSKMGIARSTVSQLVAYQYGAMVLFVMVSPIVIKKLGKVVCLGGMALLAIPFILLIANGQAFGSAMIPAVGIGLFFRSGFANLSSPVQQSLPMEFVSKELRPAYSSVIFVVMGAAQILAGLFSRSFLLQLENGYGISYYVTGAIYASAAIMLLLVFTKKYNRSNSDEENAEAAA